MPQGVQKPSNQILAMEMSKTCVLEMEIGANATAAKMLPGRVVIFDDADQTVKEAGAAAQGVVGILEVDPAGKKTDAYAVGDQAKLIVGEALVVGTLLASENVSRGDALVCAADGKLAKLAVAAVGSQGDIVGYSWEASNVTVDAEILVHWKPSLEAAAVA